MLVDVIPALKLPRHTKIYSYSLPPKLEGQIKIGQIIEVNFRNKNIQGLVINIKEKKPKYKLKEINQILFPNSLITSQQIKLIQYIAEYYGVAPSIVAKSMLPIVPKRQKNLKKISHIKIKKQQKYNKKIFWYEQQKDLWTKLKKEIKNSTDQILILVPEIELIDKLAEKLNLLKKDYIENHSQIAMGKFFKNWLEILSGQKKIIIGTKISVLLPFTHLQKIIIFNSHDWNHKQSDINPRFDARQIADWLAKQNKCKLLLTTPAPSVENFKNTRIQEYKNKTQNIKTIDLKQEKFKGNYTFLSDELIFRIEDLLKLKKKILIFHNRKGLAHYVFCQDCNYVFKCPQCQISLIYYTHDSQLYCQQCGYQQEVPPLCPHCAGPNLQFKGQGIEKIKTELQQEFTSAKILAVEKTQKFKTSKLKKFDILIGTEFIKNKIDFSQFALIAFTNFDQLLNRPDFRTQEKAYQLFYEIKSQAPNSNFIIQTSDAENIVLQSISNNQPEKFYKTELEQRKTLNYPPFKNLIKIICKNVKDSSAQYKSKKLVLDLQKKFSQQIEILGPFANYPKKVFNKYNYNIILKVPLNFDNTKIIRFIPSNFVIDINPEKLN